MPNAYRQRTQFTVLLAVSLHSAVVSADNGALALFVLVSFSAYVC